MKKSTITESLDALVEPLGYLIIGGILGSMLFWAYGTSCIENSCTYTTEDGKEVTGSCDKLIKVKNFENRQLDDITSLIMDWDNNDGEYVRMSGNLRQPIFTNNCNCNCSNNNRFRICTDDEYNPTNHNNSKDCIRVEPL